MSELSTNNNKRATKKEIVEALMTKVGCETRTVKGKSWTYVTYQCPKPNCPSQNISFRAQSGFQTPYCHLRSFYGHGKSPKEQDELIKSMYHDALIAKQFVGGTVVSHFKKDALSERENAINSYLQFIVL